MPKLDDIPPCPQPPAVRSSGRVTKEYHISLVTPLFGGGAEAGTPDDTMPIRGTSIRGQLRHWWRTTVGYELGNAMWRREEEIFGSTEFPSPLDMRVLSQLQVSLIDPTYGERFGPIAYALFSAIENQQQVVQEGGSFRLQIVWDDVEALKSRREAQNKQRKKDGSPILPDTIEDISNDVGAALQAWCTFGGLGARTRRGCGAVFCSELASHLPELPGRVLLGASKPNAIEAWKGAIQAYRDFRQSPRGGKHPKTLRSGKIVQVPGRSHWPEADSIRKITGSALRSSSHASSPGAPTDEDTNDHSIPVALKELLPAFPRALLGLPINFHFADGPAKNRPGQPNLDPQDVKLIPVAAGSSEELDRMASPVITRPLWIEGKWRPGIIVFEPRIPNGLRVRLTGTRARADGRDLSYDLTPEQVLHSSLGSLRPMRGQASALEAFCDFLINEKRFEEITR